MAQQPLILAIDPGSVYLGWAVVCDEGSLVKRVAAGVLHLKGDLPTRLGAILLGVTALLDAHPIAELAIEAAFVHDNARTALVLGQARGIPIALAAARGLPVCEYAPAHVKRTLAGSGRADKQQMRQMIRVVMNLPDLPPEDEADALAVGVTHLRERGFAHLQPRVSTKGPLVPTPLTPSRLLYLQAVNAAKKTRSRA